MTETCVENTTTVTADEILAYNDELNKKFIETGVQPKLTPEEIKSKTLHELGVIIGQMTCKFRPVEGAVSNANTWVKKGKDEIFKTFFRIK